MVKGVPTAITYIQSKRNGLPALGDDVTGRTHVDKLDNGSTGKIRLILKKSNHILLYYTVKILIMTHNS